MTIFNQTYIADLSGDNNADAIALANAINHGTDLTAGDAGTLAHGLTAIASSDGSGEVNLNKVDPWIPDSETASVVLNFKSDTFNSADTLAITDGKSALISITKIDAAIQTVNIQRSKLGAVSNRLSHTVNHLTNISSNLSAAQGGIEDADFAKETTNLAKNQILQQASTAMLAQANASKQNVLSLLQG